MSAQGADRDPSVPQGGHQNGERGSTATEYSMLAGFIAIVIVIGVGLFGAALNQYYGALTNTLKAALGLP